MQSTLPIGSVFGHLTTAAEVYRKPTGPTTTKPMVRVRCACGTETDVQVSNLKAGNTKSCGCMRQGRPSGKARNHGQSKTPLYRQWKAMVRRCESPIAHNYKWYGGKGVRVCPEWRNDFLVFKAWAESTGYIRGLELDRIDSDGHYAPGNCRWRTKKANIRDRDLGWSDELDELVVLRAKELGVSPYELIRLAVEAYLLP